MRDFEFHSRGHALAYSRKGAGSRRLVFIPGLCGSRAVFGAQVAHFASRFEVVAIDALGHGVSSPVPGESYLNLTAELLREVLRALPPKPTTLIGHSLGGIVVNALRGEVGAADYVFLDSPCLLEPATLARYHARGDEVARAADGDRAISDWFGAFISPRAPCRVHALVVEEALKFEREWLQRVLRSLERPARREAAGRVMVAEGRQYYPMDCDYSWTRLYPTATRWTYEGPGHFYFLEDPAPFNEALERLLSER